MRRIVLWLASTVTVVVLLFGYHTSTNSTVTSPLDTSSTQTGSGSSGSSGSGGSTTKVYTGSTAQTRWGPVQVKITTQGSKITAVDVLEYPQQNPRDQEINGYAIPLLVEETLDAQSAQIDMVSGATITSDGYVESLQAALDQAGI